MRLFATLLLVAQLGAFAVPALATPPDAHSHHMCGSVASPTASVEAQGGEECASCDMAECGSMLGCAPVSPALTAENAPVLDLPVVPEPGVEAIDPEIDFHTIPTSPPPKP